MVCYARPASWLAVIVAVAWLAFADPVSHFVAGAALAVAVTVTTAGAAAVAALAVAAVMSTRRRRAAAGGCVGCQFRCQHAMTERAPRLWLMTTAGRGAPACGHPGGGGHQGGGPARSVPAALPRPAVRSAGTPTRPAASASAAPRWPDRPAYRIRP